MNYLRILPFLLFSLSTSASNALAQPNVLLVLADDQGWNGTSVQMDTNRVDSKDDYYQTPHLETFAQSSMRFSRAYAPAPKCSPTRCSILTGQNPAANRFTNTTQQVIAGRVLIEPSSRIAIPTEDTTLAEWIKSFPTANYRTAHYGKWHLRASGPANHGFDDGDGATDNDDGNHGGLSQSDPKKIFSLTQKAKDFMISSVQAGDPFFVQVSHYAVHTDIEARQATINRYNDSNQRPQGTRHNDPEYGAMTEDLDEGFGQLLAAIDSLGIYTNTYVIYFSDNGAAPNQSSNAPLQIGKSFIWEGGIRVPLLIRGPAIPGGSQCDFPVAGYDLYPTIAEWIQGNTQAVPPTVEGASLVPTLLSGGTMPLIRPKPLAFHSPHYSEGAPVFLTKQPRSVIMKDSLKLIVNYETGQNLLFNATSDPEEAMDRSQQLPATTYEMCVQLRDYLKSVQADMPTLDPAHSGNPGLPPDVDQDGLDDSWEFRELLTVSYDSTDDPDQDGIPNGQEQNLGTDPYDPIPVGLDSRIESRQIDVRISPQPATNQAYIRVRHLFPDQILYIELQDLNGRSVLLASMNTQQTLPLSVSGLPTGIYLLSLRNSQGIFLGAKRMVKH